MALGEWVSHGGEGTTEGCRWPRTAKCRRLFEPYPRTNFLYLIRFGWSASAPFRLCRSASYSL